MHWPFWQIWAGRQAIPQVRQFLGSFRRSVQRLPQSSGVGETHLQLPLTHDAFGLHADAVHPPQWRGSVSLFVQNVPQSSGAGGRHTQPPPEHVALILVQGVVQLPQCAGFVCTSTQTGDAGAQFVVPPPQEHAPPMQVPCGPQDWAQVPQ
jgi:hypothetical protein